MAADLNTTKRHVIPRWRNLKSTIVARELSGCKIAIQENANIDTSLLLEKIKLFNEESSIVNAAELVISGYVYKEKFDDIKKAAGFLIKNKTKITNSLYSVANELFKPIEKKEENKVELFSFNSLKEDLWGIIRDLKRKTSLYPFNPISWIEMSRFYLILGHLDKSKWAAEIAIHLAPNNRYIVRSAARLFIHCEKLERAQYIVRNANGYLYDPWLLSTEISISSLMGRSSRFIKHSNEIINSKNYSPLSISELCSSIATLQYEAGNIKNTRRLLDLSLIDPNDNSLAQASWMLSHLHNFEIDCTNLNVPNSFEALTYINALEHKFELAYKNSIKWFLDQPFSSHSTIFASYLAGTALNKYSEAVDLIDFGLKANPNNFLLLNNKSFYQVCDNQVENAKLVFSRISKKSLNKRETAIYNATDGLINCAQNNTTTGLTKYDEAINIAKDIKDIILENKLKIYKIRASLIYNKNNSSLNEISNELQSIKKNLDLKGEPVLANLILTLEKKLKNET